MFHTLLCEFGERAKIGEADFVKSPVLASELPDLYCWSVRAGVAPLPRHSCRGTPDRFNRARLVRRVEDVRMSQLPTLFAILFEAIVRYKDSDRNTGSGANRRSGRGVLYS
jgi:hypothetical protein